MVDKETADIAKIRAETELLEAQNRKARAELDNVELERAKLRAETYRLEAEPEYIKAQTRKLNRETGWYPFVAGAGSVIAALGLLKAIGVIK